MARIRIIDIPKGKKISEEEMKGIYGGIQLASGEVSWYIFPRFEDTNVKFKAAAPNEDGAQKLSISL